MAFLAFISPSSAFKPDTPTESCPINIITEPASKRGLLPKRSTRKKETTVPIRLTKFVIIMIMKGPPTPT